MSLKNSASFFNSTLTSFLLCYQKIRFTIHVYNLSPTIYKEASLHFTMQPIHSPTSATKKWATTFEDSISLWCIQDFLTAMHSIKWLFAERIPMNNLTSSSIIGGAFHFFISRCVWEAKLRSDVGKEIVKIERTSMSVSKYKPVASSSVNPYEYWENS